MVDITQALSNSSCFRKRVRIEIKVVGVNLLRNGTVFVRTKRSKVKRESSKEREREKEKEKEKITQDNVSNKKWGYDLSDGRYNGYDEGWWFVTFQQQEQRYY